MTTSLLVTIQPLIRFKIDDLVASSARSTEIRTTSRFIRWLDWQLVTLSLRRGWQRIRHWADTLESQFRSRRDSATPPSVTHRKRVVDLRRQLISDAAVVHEADAVIEQPYCLHVLNVCPRCATRQRCCSRGKLLASSAWQPRTGLKISTDGHPAPEAQRELIFVRKSSGLVTVGVFMHLPLKIPVKYVLELVNMCVCISAYISKYRNTGAVYLVQSSLARCRCIHNQRCRYWKDTATRFTQLISCLKLIWSSLRPTL